MIRGFAHIVASLAVCLTATPLAAQDVDAAGRAFADHCFSPYLTAQSARDNFGPSGARFDFYDLRPFSSAASSPVTGRALTPDTDRRCEIAFDGEAVDLATSWVMVGLTREGLATRAIDVPAGFALQQGTRNVGAVQLNPNRIAVTQVGARPGPNGTETYMNVERLIPLDMLADKG